MHGAAERRVVVLPSDRIDLGAARDQQLRDVDAVVIRGNVERPLAAPPFNVRRRAEIDVKKARYDGLVRPPARPRPRLAVCQRLLESRPPGQTEFARDRELHIAPRRRSRIPRHRPLESHARVASPARSDRSHRLASCLRLSTVRSGVSRRDMTFLPGCPSVDRRAGRRFECRDRTAGWESLAADRRRPSAR
jgi:hypothetical protein